MLIFTFSEFKDLADKLAKDSGLEHADFKVKRFPNQELYITFDANVLNKECLILSTITPPNENLLSTLLLAHTLKKEGALLVNLLLPYLAYSRQDKPKPKESMATSLIGAMLKDAGVDKVFTVDVHSTIVKGLFSVPLVSISPVSIFAEAIRDLKLLDSTLVAPDKGALEKAQSLIKMLGMEESFAYLEKQRTTGEGIRHLSFHGKTKDKAIIIDDMLDTGETLISCAKQLKDAGVKEVVIMVTHGLFTGDKWEQLWGLGVIQIHCTNTIPLKISDARIKMLSIIPLLREELGLA